MGSYYPYLYIQLWLIAPLLFFVLKKHYGGWIILLISIFLNFISDSFIINDRVYSCFIGRYIFMSVVVWNFIRNSKSIVWFYALPIISLIYWLTLTHINYSPFVDHRWSGQQFPSFFYTFFFVSFFEYSYSKINHSIQRFFVFLGKESYFIFLSQMFVFYFFKIDDLVFINSTILRQLLFCIMTVLFSIMPCYLYKRTKQLILGK